MKKSTAYLGLVCLGASLAVGSMAIAADDAAADLAKAPTAVQAAAKKALDGKKMEEFDKETLDGKWIYEAGWKDAGVDHSVLIDADGKVVQTEADVELEKLPAAVTDAVKKAEPNGKLDEAATATADGKDFYSVDVKVGDVVHVVNVDKDGKLISDQIEKSVKD